MPLPGHKTKLVCTIGPASDAPEIMREMLLAGMNIARLNFSHGDFTGHQRVIGNLRATAAACGRRLAIMADLPGPKMRIGKLAQEPIELRTGDPFTLTTQEIVGDAQRVSVTFVRLPKAVRPGDVLFLNDGMIQLEVIRVEDQDVVCEVIVGGELRSRKGLNLPGIDLGISAFTDHDRDCLQFAMENGVDAVSQSFVESAADIHTVREAAANMGHHPFIIAKIERSRALERFDEILAAADGIMIARGDLGVEIPIEQIALVQKRLMRQANLAGKPVITATQMLESMTTSRKPTRAEATDVANAILDGTDCVMLSGESAMGKYPVEAVEMLAAIATEVEPHRPGGQIREMLRAVVQGKEIKIGDLISLSVESALERLKPAAVVVPSRSGATARRITRFRLPTWITAVCADEAVCQGMQFSYGVWPEYQPIDPEDWSQYVREWLRVHQVPGELAILTQGPSPRYPEANHRMEVIDLR